MEKKGAEIYKRKGKEKRKGRARKIKRVRKQEKEKIGFRPKKPP